MIGVKEGGACGVEVCESNETELLCRERNKFYGKTLLVSSRSETSLCASALLELPFCGHDSPGLNEATKQKPGTGREKGDQQLDLGGLSTYMLKRGTLSLRRRIWAIFDYQQLEETTSTIKRMRARQIAREPPKEREY